MGGSTAWAGSGFFYVMFAGALVGTTTPGDAIGFTSANFVYASTIYGGMNYATFHKFTYTAAYT